MKKMPDSHLESVAYRNTLGAIEQSCLCSVACCDVANLVKRLGLKTANAGVCFLTRKQWG
jgi:hypothetical protein